MERANARASRSIVTRASHASGHVVYMPTGLSPSANRTSPVPLLHLSRLRALTWCLSKSSELTRRSPIGCPTGVPLIALLPAMKDNEH
jgi:hypothetical protein